MSSVETQPITTITVPTGFVACGCCRDTIEKRLRQQPLVRSVRANWEREVVEIDVDDGTTADELAELVACACGERNPVPLPQPQVSSHAHAHTAGTEAVAPAAMGETAPAEHAGMG